MIKLLTKGKAEKEQDKPTFLLGKPKKRVKLQTEQLKGFHESFTEAFAYMEEQGYKLAGSLRTSYIDGVWNQEDPEQWLSVIQIPIE